MDTIQFTGTPKHVKNDNGRERDETSTRLSRKNLGNGP